MTNIEKLARDLYVMKHRDKILQILPAILQQQKGEKES